VSILVIGGGISGLACAWQLRKTGLPVILLERSARFGGVIDSAERNGFHFDVGPQSFSATEPLTKLIEELGLAGEVLRADPRAPRYILLGGRLVRVPMGLGELLRTPLISWRTKLRFLREPFGRTRPPEGDESIASFVRRKFGEDLLTNLVAPFVSGVYAGDPEKLSLNSAFPGLREFEERFGSVIRGAIKSRRKGGGGRPSLCNFKNGTVALTAALGDKLGAAAICGAEITAVRRRATAGYTVVSGGGAGFEISYNVAGVTNSLDVSAIVVAVPTDEAARLLSGIEPRFAATLSRIEYASVAQVCTGYRLAQIGGTRVDRAGGSSNSSNSLDSRRSAEPQAGADAASSPAGRMNALRGFGFLVPRTEHLRILGTVWNSALFPRRVFGSTGDGPVTDRASFTSFVGGATDAGICQQSNDEIAQIVQQELSSVMGITGPPAAIHVARWGRAIPQYNIGHARLVAELRELCAETPGIFLAGNYLSGPSLGACVEQASKIADSVALFVPGTS
jgi:oxygen-dependent protoporphyrinogen oxidase